MRKVIVTGSRDYTDRARVGRELHEALCDHLVVGDCPTGADLYARQWANRNRVRKTLYAADWRRLRKAAGPDRNERMVSEHRDADLCLAFFQPGAANRGTSDCVSRAEHYGIPVRRIYESRHEGHG